MDSTGYIALSRQRGLKLEMSVIANNIANMSTPGYRGQGVVFSEYLQGAGSAAPHLSMTDTGAFRTNLSQASLAPTGGPFDLAIEGEGFFQLGTEEGLRLTRAGAFLPDAEGRLVTAWGAELLDSSGSPILVPTDAGPIVIAEDGTLSIDGQPLAQVGVFRVDPGATLQRSANATFETAAELQPSGEATVHQGFLEDSNVNPVLEVARMIEVQRRYEAAKDFLDKEHQRISRALQDLSK